MAEKALRITVNGKNIGTNPFITTFIGNSIIAMVSALHGVEDPKEVQISVDVEKLKLKAQEKCDKKKHD